MRKSVLAAVGVLAAIALNGTPTYGMSFYCVSNNSAVDCAAGVDQLAVEVVDLGSGQVRFDFTNSGPNASSITDVYFDDGTLLGIASIVNGTGVNFSQGATPGDLPSGNNATPPFQTTAGFSADSDEPPPLNGVNPGEQLGIIFNLINGQDYADTLAALADGSLRIGIHVQGFDGGGSESFVNTPVPEPGFYGLLSLGLGGLYLLRRRKTV